MADPTPPPSYREFLLAAQEGGVFFVPATNRPVLAPLSSGGSRGRLLPMTAIIQVPVYLAPSNNNNNQSRAADYDGDDSSAAPPYLSRNDYGPPNNEYVDLSALLRADAEPPSLPSDVPSFSETAFQRLFPLGIIIINIGLLLAMFIKCLDWWAVVFVASCAGSILSSLAQVKSSEMLKYSWKDSFWLAIHLVECSVYGVRCIQLVGIRENNCFTLSVLITVISLVLVFIYVPTGCCLLDAKTGKIRQFFAPSQSPSQSRTRVS